MSFAAFAPDVDRADDRALPGAAPAPADVVGNLLMGDLPVVDLLLVDLLLVVGDDELGFVFGTDTFAAGLLRRAVSEAVAIVWEAVEADVVAIQSIVEGTLWPRQGRWSWSQRPKYPTSELPTTGREVPEFGSGWSLTSRPVEA